MVDTNVIVSLVGTIIGSISGIIISNKLTNYRIEQLEKKVDKHNNIVERMYKAEGSINTMCAEIVDLRRDVEKRG